MKSRKGFIEAGSLDLAPAQEPHTTWESAHNQPIKLDPDYVRSIRPLRNLALVVLGAPGACFNEAMEALLRSLHGAHLLSLEGASRVPPLLVGKVIAAGPECPPEVRPGAIVLVEPMSSPDGMPNLVDVLGRQLAFVPTHRLPGSAVLEEAMERIGIEMSALDAFGRETKDKPERQDEYKEAEARYLRLNSEFQALHQRREMSKRSARFKPINDPGKAEGILAVLDEEEPCSSES